VIAPAAAFGANASLIVPIGVGTDPQRRGSAAPVTEPLHEIAVTRFEIEHCLLRGGHPGKDDRGDGSGSVLVHRGSW